jgi:tRNA A37 methylthiotransferase MiaB
MRRRYDTAWYRALLDRILEAMPEASIGTDLIVGFPAKVAKSLNGASILWRRCR